MSLYSNEAPETLTIETRDISFWEGPLSTLMAFRKRSVLNFMALTVLALFKLKLSSVPFFAHTVVLCLPCILLYALT